MKTSNIIDTYMFLHQMPENNCYVILRKLIMLSKSSMHYVKNTTEQTGCCNDYDYI